jgi:hypothetical protein
MSLAASSSFVSACSLADTAETFNLRLIHMACDAVLALHWTLAKGIGLSDTAIGLIGFTGGIATAYVRWKSTA